MIINDLDGYYIVFDTKNWNTELDTLVNNLFSAFEYLAVFENFSSFLAIFCTYNKNKNQNT